MKIRSPLWFLSGIAIIPLVYSTHTIDPAFTLRVILLAALTIVTIIATRKQPIRHSPILYIWCIFAAFNIISIFVAQNSGEAIYKASIVLLYAAWLFAAMQLVTREIRPMVLRTIAILGFAISMISLFQFLKLGFGDIPSRHIPSATMTTRNLMSSFLFLTLPAILFVSIIEEKAWCIFGLVSWTTSIFVLLIAQTRAVWLGSATTAFVAIALFIISSNRKRLWERYRTNIRNSTIALGACLITVFVFNFPPRIEEGERSAAEKAGTITNYTSDSSAVMRLTVWRESLEMLRDHPALGVGAGNWKIEFPRYGLSNFQREEQDGKLQWTEAHNEFISALCETGMAGGLTFAMVFVFAFYIAARFSLNKGNNSSEAVLAIIIAAMTCGYAAISFFDFPNSRVEHSMVFLLWLSMLPFGIEVGKKLRHETPTWIAIVLCLPALFLSLQRFIAETHEKQLLVARFDHKWSEVIDECNKIYNPRLLSLDALSTPILYYKAEAEGMEGDSYNALRDNLLALKAHPNHFYTLNNTGTCEAKLGNVQDGEVFLKRALAISPNFEESLLNLAALYFNEMKYDSAFECVRKCDTSHEGSRGQRIARALWDKRR